MGTSLLDDQAFETAVGTVAERIRSAAATRTPLCLRGGGTKEFYGNEPVGELLAVDGLQALPLYEPSELVITVAAGMRLADLEALLYANGQMLAFEPPAFGADATVGGCVAAGLCGPRRLATGYAGGPLRDHVLGAKMLDGRGNLLSFGGTVIKNVAGYDVSRLLAGSLGILGVIVEISLKVVPRPAEEITLRFELDEQEALECYGAWNLHPLPISASTWHAGQLLVRLSGAPAAIGAARRWMGGEALEKRQGEQFWQSVREQQHESFARKSDEVLWRCALPFGSPVLPSVGSDGTTHEWHGMQRWLKLDGSDEQARRMLDDAVRRLGGYLVRFRGGTRRGTAFAPLSPTSAAIHHRLKAEFDPQDVFNRGRLVADL